ncbi:MAG: hypothetical protein LBB48_04745 [Treponema sp.]|jgi:hypothetical protein|nr:hypothetical protein [Treponema sp.]
MAATSYLPPYAEKKSAVYHAPKMPNGGLDFSKPPRYQRFSVMARLINCHATAFFLFRRPAVNFSLFHNAIKTYHIL